jgi:site-specific DNA-methyltransferase (adenine-specific)
VELRDFQAFGEPGAIVYLADCVDLMKIIPSGSVDVVFADPPYRLSTACCDENGLHGIMD